MPIELANDEIRAWLTLLRTPGLGASGIRELLDRHGSAATSIAAARSQTCTDIARKWLAAADPALIENDLGWLEAADHHLIVCTSEAFPALLRDMPNPPVALFVVGDPMCLWSPHIAIVGARSATSSGLANARAFAKAF